MFFTDSNDVSNLSDEIDRLVGKILRMRAVRIEARQASLKVGRCGSCQEPLHGRVCWNSDCADSIHGSFILPPAETIVTVGEECRASLWEE